MPTVTDEKTTPGRRGRYPKEFRRDAAALVIDQHRTVADVARSSGSSNTPWATVEAACQVAEVSTSWYTTGWPRVRQERIGRGEREGTTTEMR